MKIITSGLGVLREYFSSGSEIIEFDESASVKDFLRYLKESGKDDFYSKIVQDGKLSPYVIALHNGLSIDMKNGLGTELKDGDRLIFAVAVDGG